MKMKTRILDRGQHAGRQAGRLAQGPYKSSMKSTPNRYISSAPKHQVSQIILVTVYRGGGARTDPNSQEDK